ARAARAVVVREHVQLGEGPRRRLVRLRIEPLHALGSREALLLIAFEDERETARGPRSRGSPLEKLQREIGDTRASLERSRVEVGASNQALRTANDGLIEANDRLR